MSVENEASESCMAELKMYSSEAFGDFESFFLKRLGFINARPLDNIYGLLEILVLWVRLFCVPV